MQANEGEVSAEEIWLVKLATEIQNAPIFITDLKVKKERGLCKNEVASLFKTHSTYYSEVDQAHMRSQGWTDP